MFDFDGVIADTFSICFNISKSFDLDLDKVTYRRRFEGNINLANRDLPRGSSYNADFFSRYTQELHYAPIVRGMASVLRMLSRLSEMVIVSSSLSVPIADFLDQNMLSGCFAEILGNELEESKVKKIEMALENYKIKNSKCIFITDTLGDIRESWRAGVGPLAVSWGYHPESTLRNGHPLAVVHNPRQLLLYINKFLDETSLNPILDDES